MDLETLIGSTGVPEWILLALFFTAVMVQCFYYFGVYLRIFLYNPSKSRKFSKGISVVICARNEAHNLEKFLPGVLEQEYPDYEVVVVNDCSKDHTEEVLAELSTRYKHLRYTTIPANEKFSHGKKLALTVGLKSAVHDHVLLTDADCYPASGQWLQKMVSRLDGKREIVLGYGRYEKRKGLLNAMIRYETVFTAIQYFSFALKGYPYMGVGRNLAYRKALFFKNGGFSSHYHIASGDDDLFVNEHAGRNNTAIEIDPESHTVSVPNTSFVSWIRQKQRHLSAGNLYNTGSRFRLGAEIISRLLLYSTFTTLCFISVWMWPILILFGLFLVTRITIFKLGMMRLNEKYLLLPSLLFDPVLPLILGIIWFSNIFVTKYQSWS
jgi:biofilm PGA synthesis N-glycosyltransferase PgaC